MRIVIGVVLTLASLAGLLGGLGTASADASLYDALESMTSKYPFAQLVPGSGDQADRFLYADIQTHVHVFQIKDGRLEVDWETTNLGGPVTSLFVKDVYADGNPKLVVATGNGRIMFYEMSNYDLEWENHQDRYESVEYMIAENLDDDPQDELVILADDLMTIYDALNKTIEWQSQDEFSARQMITGNVDEDDQLEIILNTGMIVDSRFYNVEFEADKAFGERISLLDINGDGIPEIIGENLDFTLSVFDVYAEREIW